MRDGDEGDVVVEASVGAALEVVEAECVLELAVVVLDAPAQLCQFHQPPTTTATARSSASRSHAAKPERTPRVIEIAWRAQRRLYARWGHLHHERRKPAGVVAIACARELAAFLWEAATLD